jgi:hypothetical protein
MFSIYIYVDGVLAIYLLNRSNLIDIEQCYLNFILRNLASLNNIGLSRTVYFSLIESNIRYSIILWGLSSKKNLKKTFTLQKRAIR